jgi:spermidine/putrescine-binding protein
MSDKSDLSGLAKSVSRRTVLLAATGGAALLGGLPPVLAATSVTFLGYQGYDTPLTTGGFLDAHGISLQTTYINNNEDIIAKLKAGGTGTIDLATPNMAYIPLMIEAGLLEPIDLMKLPNLSQVMPFFADQELIRKDGVVYAVPFTWGTQPLMYRPDLVVEKPTSWMDVMRPEYKRKVVMTGSHVGNTQVWGKVVTGAEVPSWMTPAQLKETIDFLIKLKKEQALTYTDSYGEMADIFARGEAVISTMGWEPVAGWAKKKGVEVAYVYPKEGTTGFVDTYVVPKNAPNPDAAHQLINNALSEAAQTFVAVEFGQGIVSQAAIAKLSDEARKAYPYDDMASLAQRAKFYPFPPLEDDGVHATYDMIIKEWERFLRS